MDKTDGELMLEKLVEECFPITMENFYGEMMKNYNLCGIQPIYTPRWPQNEKRKI